MLHGHVGRERHRPRRRHRDGREDVPRARSARSLQRQPPPSAFEQGTRAFGLLILRLALFMVLFVLLVNAWRGRPWLDSFLFAIALAVGLAPELLPMVVSVTLSRGAIRMSRRKVLVKRLAAIHDLGSMDVLCTDKTGTLTEARIRLEQHLDPQGRDSARVLRARVSQQPLRVGPREPARRRDPRVTRTWTYPAGRSSTRSRSTSSAGASRSWRAGTERLPLLVIKGAFEDILRLSSGYEATAPRRAAARRRAPGEPDGALRGARARGVPRARHRLEAAAAGAAAPSRRATRATSSSRASRPSRTLPRRARARRCAASARAGHRGEGGDGRQRARRRARLSRSSDLPIGGVLTGAQIQEMDDLVLDARVEDDRRSSAG